MSPFDVDVTDLLEEPGARRSLVFEAPLDGLERDLARIDPSAAMRFDLLLESVEEGVLVRGTVTAPMTVVCRRCLAESSSALVLQVAEVYRPPSDVWEEGYEIRERSIDLRPMVRDNVLLDLPQEPVCSPDCLGLCPQCGANRNAGECGCTVAEGDERWAALRSLLER